MITKITSKIESTSYIIIPIFRKMVIISCRRIIISKLKHIRQV
jgi:hypothetical protein